MQENIFLERRSFAVLLIFSFLAASLIVVPTAQKAQETGEKAALFGKFAESDAVTEEIRDKSKEFVKIQINKAPDRQKAAAYGKIIEDYGTFVIAAKNRAKNSSVPELETQVLDTTISLPNGKFEPLRDLPAETFKPDSAKSEPETELIKKDYYIVQFGGFAKDEWLDSLREAGAEVVQYVPNQAFMVYADNAAMSEIAGHSRVRWVGKYAPERKISPETNDFAVKAESEIATFDVAVFRQTDLAEISLNFADAVGGQIKNQIKLENNFFNVLRVEMPFGEAAKTAALPGVFRIDRYVEPQLEDERAAQIVAGNYASQTVILPPGYNPLGQFGVNGQNVTVAVVDDGISIFGTGGYYITAANVVNGPLRGAAAGAATGHGHLNASLIAGDNPISAFDPLGYNYGAGIANKANIINIPKFVPGYAGTEADTVNDAVTTVGLNGVRGFISNNSWGSDINNNAYDSFAAQYDGFVQDASSAPTIDPACLVFSAGNAGVNGLTRPKMAKNIITVGNSENLRTEINGASANNIDDLTASSSRGPAADGRVKPDVVAPGTIVTGARGGSGSGVSGSIDANVSYASGTSHSAPQVAGAAALFTQYWKNANGGVNPSPALIKAAIINTAQEMNAANTDAAIPNGAEGWGRLNLKYMLNTGVPMKYIDQSVKFSGAGETDEFRGSVSSSTKPFRISLVWTDPPGAADPSLVNNLDLTVTVGNTVYKGNVFAGGSSAAGGNYDTVNNVENVFLPAGIPAGTPVSVKINAASINGDGILDNADNTDQHFSLVAYNFGDSVTPQTPNPNKIADFDGDGKTDIAVFRPSNGVWYVLGSRDNAFFAAHFGSPGDRIVPGDYDGDNKTDYAVFRPSNGAWYIFQSRDGFAAAQFGLGTDLPVQGDYDGDGRFDLAVFRPSNGVWYILGSTAGFYAGHFGTDGDRPVPGDYDGDGKTDLAVFRPSNNAWYLLRSAQGFAATVFGSPGDKVVPSDYDGDGKTDIAVWRESTGGWYIQHSQSGFGVFGFGASGDRPAPGDFDGDKKADLTLFRESSGAWYRNNSTNAAFSAVNFGLAGDRPVSAGYVPVQ